MWSYDYVTSYSYMKRSEKEVRDFFNRYAKELSDRKREMILDINDWRSTLVRQINDHADEQTRLLEQEYRKETDYMNNAREQLMNAARPLDDTRDTEQLKQLLEQCNALKRELATLEFPEHTNPFVQIMTEEKITQKKRNERGTERTEDTKSGNKPGGNHGNYDANDSSAYGNAASKPTSSTPRHTDRQISTTTVPSIDFDASKSSNSNSNRMTKDIDDPASKCPVCYMIFPLHMSESKRRQHADEHFRDS